MERTSSTASLVSGSGRPLQVREPFHGHPYDLTAGAGIAQAGHVAVPAGQDGIEIDAAVAIRQVIGDHFAEEPDRRRVEVAVAVESLQICHGHRLALISRRAKWHGGRVIGHWQT